MIGCAKGASKNISMLEKMDIDELDVIFDYIHSEVKYEDITGYVTDNHEFDDPDWKPVIITGAEFLIYSFDCNEYLNVYDTTTQRMLLNRLILKGEVARIREKKLGG